MGLKHLMPPRAANLTAKIDSVEDGILRIYLRGGRGNPIVETWQIFETHFSGFHAERYDQTDSLVSAGDRFKSAGDALRWLRDAAWETHSPESLTIYPSRVTRVLKGGL